MRQEHLHGVASNQVAALCRTTRRDSQRLKLHLHRSVYCYSSAGVTYTGNKVHKLCWEAHFFVITVASVQDLLPLVYKGRGYASMFPICFSWGLNLHPYLEKNLLWSSRRQDSTEAGESPSNRGVERRRKPRGLACCAQGHLGKS